MYFLQNATDQISNSLIPLQDISRTLSHTDTINTYLVIFTALLAIATIGFGLWDRKRQNDEQFERVRPWITIKEPYPIQAILQNEDTISWDLYLQTPEPKPIPVKVKVGLLFTNTGIRPARKLKKIDFAQDAPMTKDVVERKQEKDDNIDLGPSQSYYQFFEIPWESHNNLIERPIYFALRLSYDNGKYRSYSGAIYKYSHGQSNAVVTWYT